MITKKPSCIFCGNTANTKEDIFPKWLLKQKYLYNKELNLLDGTFISYRYLKIPICRRCNNETLSRIEDKIKKQKGTDIDYYLWMLKIYIGILYKESLLFRHASKNKKPIISVDKISDELLIAKQIFSIYRNKGSFYPNPPGSVIRIKREDVGGFFDYVDITQVPIQGIALPNEFVICLPFDKGRTASLVDKSKFPNNPKPIIFRFHIAELGYGQLRWEEDFSFLTVEGKILISPGSLRKQEQREFNNKEFIKILNAVGLTGIKKGNKWGIVPITNK